MNIKITLVVIWFIFSQTKAVVRHNTTLYRLHNDLFLNYQSSILPVLNPHSSVNVTIYTFLYELLDVREVENVIVLSGLIEMYWTDELLTWNPADYEGLDEIYVPANRIWLPSMALYNSSVNTGQFTPIGEAEVDHQGRMEYRFPFLFHALCSIKVRYFPWDIQNCTFAYGPSNRYSSDINVYVKHSYVNLNYSLSNQEWVIMKAHNQRRVYPYPDNPNEHYSLIEYNIEIERAPYFFIYTLVIPTALIGFIAGIAFFTPYNSKGERQEKCRIGLSAFTSMLVLQLNIVNSLPKAANVVPLIGVYFTSMLVLIGLGILLGSLILQLEITTRKVPQCCKKLFVDVLPNFLPFTVAPKPKTDTITMSSFITKIVEKQTKNEKILISKEDKSNVTPSALQDTKECNGNQQNLSRFLKNVDKAISQWPELVKLIAATQKKEVAKAEWQTFVNVLEKLFGILFLILWAVVLVMFFQHGWY